MTLNKDESASLKAADVLYEMEDVEEMEDGRRQDLEIS